MRPCPFCGSTDLSVHLDDEWSGASVTCMKCEASGPWVSVLEASAPEAREALAVGRWDYRKQLDGEPHCPTCICGKRAPVQSDQAGSHDGVSWTAHPAGSIEWSEHLLAWSEYARRYGHDQSAERLAERGGFGWGELCMFLGHEPTTWKPR